MSERGVLLLCSVMKRGFGVSVVAHEVAARIRAAGWKMTIGCLEHDEWFAGEDVVVLPPAPQTIFEFCERESIDVVVAQTSPYFEVLPALEMWIPTIVFEHGDPTPSMFADDARERELIKVNKLRRVYPRTDAVLTSSHFLRHDIGWPQAGVVPLGCDHVDDHGHKDRSVGDGSDSPLRVGTLMRLGAGEARYKGLDEYLQIIEAFAGRPGFEFQIMGRGEESDREWWEERGVRCHLNATDEERSAYLRDLDVFISPSRWEGFNLPLVEAHASGTVGLAFDVGAHPETTPYLLAHLSDATFLLEEWAADRTRLLDASDRCYDYARSRFPWEATAVELASHLDRVVTAGGHVASWRRSRPMRIWRMVVGRYRIDGFGGIAAALLARVPGRAPTEATPD